jgi:hypothetical protein
MKMRSKRRGQEVVHLKGGGKCERDSSENIVTGIEKDALK